MLKVILCLLVLFGAAYVATGQANSAYDVELNRGRMLLRRSQFEEALKSFKRANEMQGKKCTECLSLMTEAYLGLEEYQNAAETSDKVIALAGNNKELASKA